MQFYHEYMTRVAETAINHCQSINHTLTITYQCFRPTPAMSTSQTGTDERIAQLERSLRILTIIVGIFIVIILTLMFSLFGVLLNQHRQIRMAQRRHIPVAPKRERIATRIHPRLAYTPHVLYRRSEFPIPGSVGEWG